MDPKTFLGGAIVLDVDRAKEIFDEKVARPLGMGVEEAAIGIYRIAAAQIADLIREVTVERGLDPRDFDIHSFGGSCSLFAGAFAKDLAVRRVIVPFAASVNCAFGMVAADVIHEYSRSEPMTLPADVEFINSLLEPMARHAGDRLMNEGFAKDRIRLEFSVELRYRRQVHQVVTPLRGAPPFTASAVDALVKEFEELYERRFGRGSAFRAAGIELVNFRLRARGLIEAPVLTPEKAGGLEPKHAELGQRRIYDDTAGKMTLAQTYDFQRLGPGNVVQGPAVIHTPITTIVIQSRQTGRMDSFLATSIVENVA